MCTSFSRTLKKLVSPQVTFLSHTHIERIDFQPRTLNKTNRPGDHRAHSLSQMRNPALLRHLARIYFPFTALTSISTRAHGAPNPATCFALLPPLFRRSFLP